MALPKTRFSRSIWVIAILVCCGAALQLIQPKIENPPVTQDIGAPAAVEQILRRDCYDCHSNETKLLWFDKITPANFLVARDIKLGREVLNFSHWDSLSKGQQSAKLFESFNQASFRSMPLSDYTRFHTDAKISDQDLQVLRNYVASLAPAIQTDSSNSARSSAASSQYTRWIAAASRSMQIRPALNGIAFPSDFNTWQVIGTTERWDNGTMRVIFGNAVVVKAIDEKQTNPWPDGAVFAKAAWDQVIDSSGMIHPGAFKQVEFMIKDKGKYAATEGWGFARWIKGLDLVPYGSDANFATECTNCHLPMKGNDFVYTIPTQHVEGKVIATGIDKSKKSTFTLYENKTAAGKTLSLVTWDQTDDPHWFGANIPNQIKSVEKVSFRADSLGYIQPVYETSATMGSAKDRLDFIVKLRPSILP